MIPPTLSIKKFGVGVAIMAGDDIVVCEGADPMDAVANLIHEVRPLIAAYGAVNELDTSVARRAARDLEADLRELL